MKLLLIEDDLKLADHLTSNLREHGFFTLHAADKAGLEENLARSARIDFVLLDRLLGTTDSKHYMARIRKKWPAAPVLVLSAVSTPNERTELINMGADDYMGKPFSMQELVARIKALLRRTSVPIGTFSQVGDLVIDMMKRTVSVGGRTETLPAKEFLLLRTLMDEAGRVWSKNELLDYVWGQAADVETNVVEATIASVRRKIEDLGSKALIKNMRNVGYWIEE